MTLTTQHVTSADGTTIGYLRDGNGPAIVLVQGAGADAWAYRDLAAALASDFTVVIPDRRGRGMSPKPYHPDHDIARDVEDLAAVMQAEAATRIFGLSSGAMITLEAARTLPQVTAAAVFEPPFLPGGLPQTGIRHLNQQIEDGDLPGALVSALLLSGTAPAPLRRLPRHIARLLAAALIAVDAHLPGPRTKQRDLLPGVRYDFHDVASRDTRMHDFATIDIPVLLLSGTRSPDYLQQGVRDLTTLLPRSTHIELDGLGHDGPWNRQQGGHPTAIAHTLRTHLLTPAPSPHDPGSPAPDTMGKTPA